MNYDGSEMHHDYVKKIELENKQLKESIQQLRALAEKWRRQSKGLEAPWDSSSKHIYGVCADELDDVLKAIGKE